MTAVARTYRVDPNPEALGGFTITCLLCGLTSAHPGDVAELFCASCEHFHEDPQAQGPHPRQRRGRAPEERAMSELSYRQMAASAYRSYVRNVVGKNFAGLPLPSWEDLPTHRQVAWECAVRQVEICLLTPEDADASERRWTGWTPEETR